VDEIEELLARYRPVGPPAALRARITEGRSRVDERGRLAGWALAAAAILCALIFYLLAAREHQQIAARLPAPPVVTAPEALPEFWP
jgi:hypothetical protein